jgi:hypothetical protein
LDVIPREVRDRADILKRGAAADDRDHHDRHLGAEPSCAEGDEHDWREQGEQQGAWATKKTR